MAMGKGYLLWHDLAGVGSRNHMSSLDSPACSESRESRGMKCSYQTACNDFTIFASGKHLFLRKLVSHKKQATL